jgi:hypothetical protein
MELVMCTGHVILSILCWNIVYTLPATEILNGFQVLLY